MGEPLQHCPYFEFDGEPSCEKPAHEALCRAQLGKRLLPKELGAASRAATVAAANDAAATKQGFAA